MSLFALAISYLTTSNLSCFLDLTSQVPVQYRSLQHRTLQHPSSVTFTVGRYFRFGLASSFLLELFFHPSLVAYWVPTVLGSLSFSVIYFCLFILFMGFSRQYWSELPFPSPGGLPDPGIKPRSPALIGRFFFFFPTRESPG